MRLSSEEENQFEIDGSDEQMSDLNDDFESGEDYDEEGEFDDEGNIS